MHCRMRRQGQPGDLVRTARGYFFFKGLVLRPCKPLEVVRGRSAQEALLLPEGRRLLAALRTWLSEAQAKKKQRWIVYLHLLAPNAPEGMLELLSSEDLDLFSSYIALK